MSKYMHTTQGGSSVARFNLQNGQFLDPIDKALLHDLKVAYRSIGYKTRQFYCGPRYRKDFTLKKDAWGLSLYVYVKS